MDEQVRMAVVDAELSVGGLEVRVSRNESTQEIRVAVEDYFADRRPEDLLLLHRSLPGQLTLPETESEPPAPPPEPAPEPPPEPSPLPTPPRREPASLRSQ